MPVRNDDICLVCNKRVRSRNLYSCILCNCYYHISCIAAEPICEFCLQCRLNVFPFSNANNMESQAFFCNKKIPTQLKMCNNEDLLYKAFDDNINNVACSYFLTGEFDNNFCKAAFDHNSHLSIFYLNCRSIKQNGDALFTLLSYLSFNFDITALS